MLGGFTGGANSPIQASGGHASSDTGDMFGGGFNTGSLNYNSKTPVWVWLVIALAVVFVVWQMKK